MKYVRYTLKVCLIILLFIFYSNKFDNSIEIADLEVVLVMGLDSKKTVDEANFYLESDIINSQDEKISKNTSDLSGGDTIEYENDFVTLTYLRNDLDAEKKEISEEKNDTVNESKNLSNSNVFTINSRTYLQALKESQRFSEKVFATEVIKYYVIGEETAILGFNKELEYISRNPDLSLNAMLLVAKGGTANELLKKADEKLYRKLDNVINTTLQYTYLRELSVLKLMKASHSINKSGVLPVLEIIGMTGTNEINISGLAIYNSGKVIDYISSENSKYFSMLTHYTSNARGFSIDILNSNEGYTSVNVTKTNVKPKFEFNNNQVRKITYDIDVICGLGELQTDMNIENKYTIINLESKISEKIKKNIFEILEKEKLLKSDFLRLSDYISSLYPSKWEKIYENFEDNLVNIEFEVNVKTHINRTYSIIYSNSF